MNEYKKEEVEAAPNPLLTLIEAVNTLGFSLIIGGIIYFIIGSVAGLVNSTMLDWSLCGSVHYWVHADWCSFSETADQRSVAFFIHRLLNIPLPWFMLFWGFLLTALCAILLRFFPDRHAPVWVDRENRRL